MKRILLFWALIFTLSYASDTYSQETGYAKIKGVVSDSATGEKLFGASVGIVGTSFGAATNLDGEYIISNIKPGTYAFKIRYLGYKGLDFNIQLKPGETLELNGSLSAESLVTEEVIVTAQVRGQRAAINQMRSSNEIINVVSSDKIRDVPDANAAESIGRLPGVSLQRSGGEGNKVVVRGLSPQFTIVQVDGVRLSGIDDDRGVGMSTISSEMLDGIELSKSLTADKDADAIGGIINLRTRVAEKGFHVDALALGGYNGLEKSYNNYKFSINAGNRFFKDKFGVLMTVGKEKVIRSSDNFDATYTSNPTAVDDQLLTDYTSLNERKRNRNRTHGGIVLDYKNDFMKIKFNNIFSKMVDENIERVNNYRFINSDFQLDLIETIPTEKIQTNSLNTEFNILNTQLNADFSYSKTNLSSDEDLYHFENPNVLPEGLTIKPAERLFALPSHLIDSFYTSTNSIDKSIFMWNDRENLSREDVTKRMALDWKIPLTLSEEVSGYVKVGGKYSKKMRKSNTQTRRNGYFGGIGMGKANDVYDIYFPQFLRPQDLGFSQVEGIAGKNFEDPNYKSDDFMNGRYELAWSPDLDYLKFVNDSLYRANSDDLDNYDPIQGVTSYADDYENTEELLAGYIMAEINIGKRFMLMPGVRYENEQTEYTSFYAREDPFAPSGLMAGYPVAVTAKRNNTNWFPSINIKYDVNEWMDVRGAYYKSASRPDYALLSPSMVANNNLSILTSYNPYLIPALAHNYDLGVSIFTNKIGLFTANIFYKEISNLLYRLPNYKPEYFNELEGAPESLLTSLEKPRELYDPSLYKKAGTENNDMPINNPNKSYYKGFEVSWQTNFWYLPGALKGIVLDLNYSMIWSKTKLPYIRFETVTDSSGPFPIPKTVPIYATRESRMLDQPASMFNARVGWDFKGFSTRLSFRYQGATIRSVDPLLSLLDEVTGDQFLMDLSIKQKIVKGLSVSLDISNLTRFVDDRFIYAQDHVLPRAGEYYGSTVQLGLRYKL
jgi:TonB-dependent receptor